MSNSTETCSSPMLSLTYMAMRPPCREESRGQRGRVQPAFRFWRHRSRKTRENQPFTVDQCYRSDCLLLCAAAGSPSTPAYLRSWIALASIRELNHARTKVAALKIGWTSVCMSQEAGGPCALTWPRLDQSHLVIRGPTSARKWISFRDRRSRQSAAGLFSPPEGWRGRESGGAGAESGTSCSSAAILSRYAWR